MINLVKKFFSIFMQANTSVCSICHEVFNEKNLTSLDNLNLCPKDFEIYQKNEWKQIKEGVSNPEDPEQALEVQNLHTKLKEQGIPAYIKTEYKIINDQISTVFKLFAPEDHQS